MQDKTENTASTWESIYRLQLKRDGENKASQGNYTALACHTMRDWARELGVVRNEVDDAKFDALANNVGTAAMALALAAPDEDGLLERVLKGGPDAIHESAESLEFWDAAKRYLYYVYGKPLSVIARAQAKAAALAPPVDGSAGEGLRIDWPLLQKANDDLQTAFDRAKAENTPEAIEALEVAQRYRDSWAGYYVSRILANRASSAATPVGEDVGGEVKWVSVDERLPEYENEMFYGPYWLVCEDGEITGGHFRCQNKFNDYTWNGDKHENGRVTHYMVQFLPTAPVALPTSPLTEDPQQA